MKLILFSVALLCVVSMAVAACDSTGGTANCKYSPGTITDTTQLCDKAKEYWNCLKPYLDGCSTSITDTFRAAINAIPDCNVDAGSSHVTVSAFAMIFSLLLAIWRGFN